ncbi:MAG: TlpA disulfide reductase family protein [Chloroflexi bacterium]|nr:TlpA disulfide reductase family protein [Chloroflexota bacterium]
MGGAFAVRPMKSVLRFFRDIQFNLLHRPRNRRELANRLAVVAAAVVAGFLPFLIEGSGQAVEEVASRQFVAALAELDESRASLSVLNDDPNASAARIEGLEARIAELVEETFLGYVEREGDAPREGALIPDFRLLDFNGSPVQISALGKPVIVNFWASWCAACIEEMPDLQRLHEAVGDRVVVVGVNRGESLQTATRFADETGASYTLLLDLQDELGDNNGPYRIIGMPTTLYVRADGRIAKTVIGFQTLEQMEELTSELLGEQLDITMEVVDESFTGRVTDVIDSQTANHAVFAELIDRFAVDATLIDDAAWPRNVVAQTNAWKVNLDRFRAITAPEVALGLYQPVLDALELLDAAGTLIRTGVEDGDLVQLEVGVGLFEEARAAFDEASEDIEGFLSTL